MPPTTTQAVEVPHPLAAVLEEEDRIYPFMRLPDEIIVALLLKIDAKTVFACICVCKHLARLVAQNDAPIWKPKVLEITIDSREPALLKHEKWIDIYRQYTIWSRFFDLSRNHRAVTLKPVNSLPPLEPPSSDGNQITTRRHITGTYKHPPPHIDSDCILLDKTCCPGGNRVVFERNGELYWFELGSREMECVPMEDREAVITPFPLKEHQRGGHNGSEMHIRVSTRSEYVAVWTDSSSEFYCLDNGKHLGTLEGAEEEASLCGRMYASTVYNSEARSSVLQLWQLKPRDNLTTTSSSSSTDPPLDSEPTQPRKKQTPCFRRVPSSTEDQHATNPPRIAPRGTEMQAVAAARRG
ncbi:hypothetical protein HK097_002573, partial [Rhizophlyctis rosea]